MVVWLTRDLRPSAFNLLYNQKKKYMEPKKEKTLQYKEHVKLFNLKNGQPASKEDSSISGSSTSNSSSKESSPISSPISNLNHDDTLSKHISSEMVNSEIAKNSVDSNFVLNKFKELLNTVSVPADSMNGVSMPVYVSLDLNAIVSSDSPGTSLCNSAIGLSAQEVLGMSMIAGANPNVWE